MDLPGNHPASPLVDQLRLEKVVSTESLQGNLPTESVVCIESVKKKLDPCKPWREASSRRKNSGSGFMISFERAGRSELGILTNSHVVHEATMLMVRKLGAHGTFPAKLVCEAVAVDLALLSVDDSTFWDGSVPLVVQSELPKLYSDVLCIGYPVGGMGVCVTKGVVSRLSAIRYAIDNDCRAPRLLAIQIGEIAAVPDSPGLLLAVPDSPGLLLLCLTHQGCFWLCLTHQGCFWLCLTHQGCFCWTCHCLAAALSRCRTVSRTHCLADSLSASRRSDQSRQLRWTCSGRHVPARGRCHPEGNFRQREID